MMPKSRYCKFFICLCGVVVFNVLLFYQQQNHSIGSFTNNVGRIFETPSKSPVKTVVILTYQRCGSSFLGRLFDLDPRVFYVFEPLDGFYSSMYGTYPGWNVPSNIVTYKNGTERVLPSYEVAGISNFLVDLFNCDVSKLPTAFMAHPFWKLFKHQMNSANKYIACLMTFTQNKCNVYLRDGGLCASEFGLNGPEVDERCYRLLHPELYQVDRTLRADEQVKNYTDCESENRRLVDAKCSSSLKSACSSRSTRVVKLVRGTMETMQPLLRLLPETRVIHLLRDPRAVSLSRFKFVTGGRGHYSRAAKSRTDHLTREASVYCRQVVADIRWRQLLEREFPGRFYTLTYEQLETDPRGRASDIYRFIGETDIPPKIAGNFTFLAEEGNDKVTAKSLATQWQKQLTPIEKRQIDKQCTELMKIFPEYSSGQDDDEVPK